MPDKQTGTGSLESRTDDDGHITPAADAAQRSEDIDEQVRRAREGEVSIGENTVLPGVYGPDSIVQSGTETRPQPDGQTDEEARVRSEAIDRQVENTSAGGMITGVQAAGGSGTGDKPLSGSVLATEGPTVDEDSAHAATHDAAGHDLRDDPQAEALSGLHEDKAESLTELTVADLRARAKAEDISLGGATAKPEIVKAIEKARKAKQKAEEKAAAESAAAATEDPTHDAGHGTIANPTGLKPEGK